LQGVKAGLARQKAEFEFTERAHSDIRV
jgi:hypothetical protein